MKSKDEIFEGTKEMLDIVNNKNIYSNNNQKKFWDMVNEYSPNMGKFKVLKKIGQHKGKIYPKTQNKVLLDREGIICQAI